MGRNNNPEPVGEGDGKDGVQNDYSDKEEIVEVV